MAVRGRGADRRPDRRRARLRARPRRHPPRHQAVEHHALRRRPHRQDPRFRHRPDRRSRTAAGAEATAARTQFGQVLGTPRYMSPEQAFGLELDHRSDLFSLGVVLYELITGQTAFAGTSIATLALQITQRKPEPLGKVRARTARAACSMSSTSCSPSSRTSASPAAPRSPKALRREYEALSAAREGAPPAAAAGAPDPGDGRGGRPRPAAQHRHRAQPPVQGDGADGADLGHRHHQLRRQQRRAARGRECRPAAARAGLAAGPGVHRRRVAGFGRARDRHGRCRRASSAASTDPAPDRPALSRPPASERARRGRATSASPRPATAISGSCGRSAMRASRSAGSRSSSTAPSSTRPRRSSRNLLIGLGIALLLVVLALSYAIGQSVARPVERLRRALGGRRVGASRFPHLAPPQRRVRRAVRRL